VKRSEKRCFHSTWALLPFIKNVMGTVERYAVVRTRPSYEPRSKVRESKGETFQSTRNPACGSVSRFGK